MGERPITRRPAKLQPKELTVPSDDMNSGSDLVRRCLFWWVVVLAGLAISAYLWVYLNGQLGHGFPYNTIVFIPRQRFLDFTSFYRPFEHFGTAQFRSGLGNYPAPAAYVYLLFFSLIPGHPSAAAVAYDATIAGVACMAVGLIVFALRRNRLVAPVAAALLLTLLTSYPLMFMADRANVEGAAWVAAILGMWAFARDQRGAAAFLFACAAAIKLAPLVLVFLFLRRRDWRNSMVFVGSFVAVNSLALWYAGPSVGQSLGTIMGGMRHLNHDAVLAYSGVQMGVDHSLFFVVKQALLVVCYVAGTSRSFFLCMTDIAYYMYMCMWLVAAVVLVRRFRRMPMLNCIFAAFIVQLIAPPVSYDYTLLYLYIPWALFLVVFLLQDVYSGRAHLSFSTALAILIPCAITFTPQQCYLVIGGIGHTSSLGYSGHIGFAGQVKALALLYLLVVAALNPMPCRIFGEADGAEWRRQAAISPPAGPGPV